MERRASNGRSSDAARSIRNGFDRFWPADCAFPPSAPWLASLLAARAQGSNAPPPVDLPEGVRDFTDNWIVRPWEVAVADTSTIEIGNATWSPGATEEELADAIRAAHRAHNWHWWSDDEVRRVTEEIYWNVIAFEIENPGRVYMGLELHPLPRDGRYYWRAIFDLPVSDGAGGWRTSTGGGFATGMWVHRKRSYWKQEDWNLNPPEGSEGKPNAPNEVGGPADDEEDEEEGGLRYPPWLEGQPNAIAAWGQASLDARWLMAIMAYLQR